MHMTWTTITFVHWAYEPRVVQRLLPPGLKVETFGDRAWVGLVPFRMTVWWPGVPPMPWLSVFPETNVRTYARGPDGRTGIWFLSLDAARLPAVVAARVGWGLPYFWASMSVTRADDMVRYASVRRWPGPPASLDADVRVGEPIPATELGALDHFLTARFVLWSHHLGRLWHSAADHPPWPLRRATVTRLDSTLLAAAGLPAPTTDPLVHHSDGVRVRVARPRHTRRTGSAQEAR
jgi:uncharacterized protein YqjF (DUF2071 family)